MTREHLLVLDVNEITGIRWECNKCHAAVTYRLTETINLSQRCGCGESFVDAGTYSDYAKVIEFVEKLKALRAGLPHVKATLKLELKDAVK